MPPGICVDVHSTRHSRVAVCRMDMRPSRSKIQQSRKLCPYMTLHMPPCLSPFAFLTVSATRAASVKASLTPRFFIAEHSKIASLAGAPVCSHGPGLPRYLNALIFSAMARPCL